MTDSIADRLSALKNINAQIRQQAEQAEAIVAEANPVIEQLAASGLVSEQILLGQFLLIRSYSAKFLPQDSGQVIQAGLAIPGGCGAVVWDSEELSGVREPSYESEAFWRFVRFDECEPVVKALIRSSLLPLFDQLDTLLKRG